MELLGKYRPIAHLGRGGMADVFLAIAAGPSGYNFSKLLVVKRLRARTEDDPELVTMFADEARILAHLQHPNIVQIVDVCLHDGEALIAMEYLDGLSMRRLRQRAKKEKVDLPSAVEIVALVDVLTALDYAYELVAWDGQPLAIVHRDVTPHNIIVTVDGQVKVLDFGIAKTALRDTVTAQGIIKGKLRYMSPEQARAGNVGRASDIFSVGIMLWEALTRTRFWANLDDREIARRLLVGDLETSPRAIDPGVPEALNEVCRRALAFRPEHRYPTATAMREAIEAHLGDDVLQARRRLGALVHQLAEGDRTRLRTVIERAARTLSDQEADTRDPTTVTPTVMDTIPFEAPALEASPGLLPYRAQRRALLALPVFAAFLVGGLLLAASAQRSPAPAADAPASPATSREELVLATDGVTVVADLPDDAPESGPPATRTFRPAWSPRPYRKVRPSLPPSSVRPVRGGNVALDTSDPWRADSR